MKHLNYATDRHGYYTRHVGNGISPFFIVPASFTSMSLVLSNISGGSACVKFSLAPHESYEPLWHEWPLGYLDNEGGFSYTSPLSLIMVDSLPEVSYTFEILI